jgi:hypothetical protein
MTEGLIRDSDQCASPQLRRLLAEMPGIGACSRLVAWTLPDDLSSNECLKWL